LVDFAEFLQLLAGPPQGGDHQQESDLNAFGRIAASHLGNHAAFFEKVAAGTKDPTEEHKEKIKKEYEERKKIDALRKAELEKEKEEAEEKARAQAEARQRLAAKASLFQ
jgi:hypothetical protein